jgi:hypothetical protein
MKETPKRAVAGPDGKLRAIWRAAIFYVLGTWPGFPFGGR